MKKGSYPPLYEDRWCVRCERLHEHFNPHNVAYYDAPGVDGHTPGRPNDELISELGQAAKPAPRGNKDSE